MKIECFLKWVSGSNNNELWLLYLCICQIEGFPRIWHWNVVKIYTPITIISMRSRWWKWQKKQMMKYNR